MHRHRIDDGRWDCRYVPDALSTVRAVVSNDWDALYVFQLQMAESPGSRIPNIHQGGEVEYGNVDSGDGPGEFALITRPYPTILIYT